MTHEEAKTILQSFRSDHDDASDALFQEAFALLNDDPALRIWFEQEQAFDAAFSEKFATIAPPPTLKAKLLAIQDPTEKEAIDDIKPGHKAVPFSKESITPTWWQNPMFISMAASIAIIIGFIALFFKPNNLQATDDLSRFYDAVSQHAIPSLESRSEDMNELRSYLQEQQVPSPGQLPAPLEPVKTAGCVAYDWEGRTIAVICYGKENPKLKHLYVAKRADFPNAEHPTHPAFLQKGSQAIAVWTDAQNIYVLLAQNGQIESLKQML